jgi:hypothetical protein
MNTTLTLPYLAQINHQFLHEWRQHRWLILAWVVFLWLKFHLLKGYDIWTVNESYGDSLEDIGCVVLGGWLCLRSVTGDAPANAESAILTRPLHRSAWWLAKLLFLAAAVAVPLIVMVAPTWSGYELRWGQLTALTLGWLLLSLILVVAASAIASLAASPRQVLGLMIAALIAAGGCLLFSAQHIPYMLGLKVAPELDFVGHSNSRAAWLALVVGCSLLVSWWLSTVPRRRAWAVGALGFTLVATAAWGVWGSKQAPTTHETVFPRKLSIKVGKAEPTDKAPGRPLWPTLRLVGLKVDEVASIVSFAPMQGGQATYTDLPVNKRGFDSWLLNDHVRALIKHSPPTTLWDAWLNNGAGWSDAKRQPLPRVLKTLALDAETAAQQPWELKLAIHEMRQIATVPFRQLWSQKSQFIVKPGVRLELPPVEWHQDRWQIRGNVQRLWSSILGSEVPPAALAQKRRLSDGFLIVLEDKELAEATVKDLGPSQYWPDGDRTWLRSAAFQEESEQPFAIALLAPATQLLILQQTEEQWIDRLTATLWTADERGTLDLILTPEEISQVLARK